MQKRTFSKTFLGFDLFFRCQALILQSMFRFFSAVIIVMFSEYHLTLSSFHSHFYSFIHVFNTICVFEYNFVRCMRKWLVFPFKLKFCNNFVYLKKCIVPLAFAALKRSKNEIRSHMNYRHSRICFDFSLKWTSTSFVVRRATKEKMEYLKWRSCDIRGDSHSQRIEYLSHHGRFVSQRPKRSLN